MLAVSQRLPNSRLTRLSKAHWKVVCCAKEETHTDKHTDKLLTNRNTRTHMHANDKNMQKHR